MRKTAIFGAIGAALLGGTATAQVIVHPAYRPPETVQRVAIPVDPAEKRLRVLIISGQNSYEHDWTGMNNLLRTLMQDSGRFDVRVTEDFDHGTLAMLKAYDVVLLNYSSRWVYNDPTEHRWSPEAGQALFAYVREGGGLVAYHSSFTWGYNWPEYRRLVGAVVLGGLAAAAAGQPQVRLGQLAQFLLQFDQVPIVIARDDVLAGVDVRDPRRRLGHLAERERRLQRLRPRSGRRWTGAPGSPQA